LDLIIISSTLFIFNECDKEASRLVFRESQGGCDTVHFHEKVDGNSIPVTMTETFMGIIFDEHIKCGWVSSNNWKAGIH
jgi:hypothetical protein